MWRDPDEVLNQNGDIHVLTLMPFPYSLSHTRDILRRNYVKIHADHAQVYAAFGP